RRPRRRHPPGNRGPLVSSTRTVLTEEAPMTRNRDLFHEIAAVIEADPDSYYQFTWGNGRIHDEVVRFADGTVKEITCGTRQCIAGWACSLSGAKPVDHTLSVWKLPRQRQEHVYDMARRKLGLGEEE